MKRKMWLLIQLKIRLKKINLRKKKDGLKQSRISSMK